jgi:copper chaperone CopZ
MNARPVLALASLFAITLAARAADYTVTLSNVHLCCNSCVKDANEAVGQVAGASVESDKATRSVKITAADQATAQKAVDALVGAGFYGQPSDPAIKLAQTSVPDGDVKTLKVGGVHLCCKKCVKDVNLAVAKVKGVAGTTAEADADSFEITGDFKAKDVIDALHAAGFSATVD